MALLAVLVAVLFALQLTPKAAAQNPPPGSSQTELAGKIDLARLVDLSAHRLGLMVEYDEKLLQGLSVTLRGTSQLDDQALWSLSNQMLALNGMTTIHPAGNDQGREAGDAASNAVLSVVKLTEAPNLARIEQHLEQAGGVAGYVLTIQALQHLEAKKAAELLKPLLSKAGGVVQELDARRLLIGDLAPRVKQHVAMIRDLDLDDARGVVEIMPAASTAAVQLAASVMLAAGAQNTIAPGALVGKVMPSNDGTSVIIVAPQRELASWRALIAQFDQQQAVETRSYLVGSFGLDQVATLVEQTSRQTPPRGAGERWLVVKDALTAMLIITATPAEHDAVRQLLDRLAQVPEQDRRPVRAFAIRNRNVTEVMEILSSLLEAGVFETGEFRTNIDPSDPANHQRDNRPSPLGADNRLNGRSGNSPLTPEGTSTTKPSGVSTPPARSDSRGPEDAAPVVTLTADVGTNTLIAVGEPRMLTQIEELLKTLDVRQPQVMVEVLVVSLNESDTKDLGMELEKIELSGDTVIRLTSLFGLGTPGISNPDQPIRGQGFSGLVLNPGDFRILIRALQTLNNGRALNIPKVLVNNNQQATLDAVLQQPFISTNASDTVATTSFGGFENAGTTVTVRPQIARGDHLVVEYAVMLSAFVGDSSDPGIPPPRQQNRLQSIVTIPDGYTVALGGIEVRSEGDSVSQIPFLGDVPWLGELFKNRSKSESVSKFFVFIRPSVMRHESFEDLKFLSDDQWKAAEMRADELQGAFDGWPEVKPQVIR